MGTASLVIVGVAQLFLAPKGTDAPTFSKTGVVTITTTPWKTVGFTEDGVTLNVDRKVNMIRVEEQSTPVDEVTDTTDVTVDITLAQDTIANMKYAYGGGTITTNAKGADAPATSVLTLSDTLTTLALALVGKNSYGLDRLVFIPEVIAGGKVKTSYRRAKSARLYPVTFEAVCAPSSIVITDATAVGTA